MASLRGVDDQYDLALRRVGLKMREHLGRRAAVIGLEFLGQLAGDTRAGGGIDFCQYPEGRDDTVGGLEEDTGFAGFQSGGECGAAFPGFDREEAAEAEGMTREARSDERGDHRGRAGQHFQRSCGCDTGLDQAITGIRYAGHAGVADEGDGFTGTGGGDEFRYAAGLVVLMQRDQRLAGNPVMRKQRRGMPRVLAGDAIGGLQNFQGPQRDVAEVPDRCGNNHDAAGCFVRGIHGANWKNGIGPSSDGFH